MIGKVNETQNVLLVYFEGRNNEELMEILHLNKFEFYTTCGSIPRCPWIFVNLDNKKCVLGRAGIGFATPYGDHSVTIEEFLLLYLSYEKFHTLDNYCSKVVFEKYKGLSYFKF